MDKTIRRWHLLMENELVKKWFNYEKGGNELSARSYLRNFGLFLEFINGISAEDYGNEKSYDKKKRENWIKVMKDAPERLISMVKERHEDYVDQYRAYVSRLQDDGKPGTNISIYIQATVNFLQFYAVPEARVKVKINNKHFHPWKDKETTPTNEQLATILRQADTRVGVMISLMAFSGVRPEVLGNFNGSDGLKLGDLVKVKVDGEIVEIEKTPLQINVRPKLSKNGTGYYTFLSEEGCVYLKDYLQIRSKTEKLTADSPVIKPLGGEKSTRKKSFLGTRYISRYIARAIIGSGFKWRPYVLRRYFVTQMGLAESKGLITHSWRQFITGHKGDMEATYENMNSHIEEVRESYKKSVRYLQTRQIQVDIEELDAIADEKTKRRILEVFGYTPEEFDNIDFKNLSDEDWQKMLTPRLDEVYRKIFFSRYTSEEILKQAEESREEIEEDPKSNREVIIPEEFYEAYIMTGFRMNKVASEFLRKQKKVSMELP